MFNSNPKLEHSSKKNQTNITTTITFHKYKLPNIQRFKYAKIYTSKTLKLKHNTPTYTLRTYYSSSSGCMSTAFTQEGPASSSLRSLSLRTTLPPPAQGADFQRRTSSSPPHHLRVSRFSRNGGVPLPAWYTIFIDGPMNSNASQDWIFFKFISL